MPRDIAREPEPGPLIGRRRIAVGLVGPVQIARDAQADGRAWCIARRFGDEAAVEQDPRARHRLEGRDHLVSRPDALLPRQHQPFLAGDAPFDADRAVTIAPGVERAGGSPSATGAAAIFASIAPITASFQASRRTCQTPSASRIATPASPRTSAKP